MGADRRPLATALLAGVALVIALLLLEAGLRLFTPFPIHGNQRPHEALAYVLDPRFGESDTAGFRNPAIPTRVDVVALGDSHTYGENAAREDAWPYQLARATGLAVYSFGMPGYGVLEHFWLMDVALAMHPRFVIAAIFPYNDLADYCPRAQTPYWAARLGALGLRADACAAAGPPPRAGRTPSRFEVLARRTAIGAWWYDLDRRTCFARWLGAGDDALHVVAGGDVLRFRADRLRQADRLMNTERGPIAAACRAVPVLFDAMHARARRGRAVRRRIHSDARARELRAAAARAPTRVVAIRRARGAPGAGARRGARRIGHLVGGCAASDASGARTHRRGSREAVLLCGRPPDRARTAGLRERRGGAAPAHGRASPATGGPRPGRAVSGLSTPRDRPRRGSARR